MRKRNSVPIERTPFRVGYTKLVPKQDVQNGVLCRQCVYEETNNADSLGKFNSLDFSLGNLIAIGSFSGLTYVSMSLNSDMNFVDKFAQDYAQNVSTTASKEG